MALVQFKGTLYNHDKEKELKSLLGNDNVQCERPVIKITVNIEDIVCYHQQYDEDANLLDRTDIHLRGGHSITVLSTFEQVDNIINKYRG